MASSNGQNGHDRHGHDAAAEHEHGGIVEVVEVLAESPFGWEDACERALAEAGALRHVQSLYVKDLEAIVEHGRISRYRINAKISFVVESEGRSATHTSARKSSSKVTRGESIMGRMDESRQGFRGRDEERGRFEGRDRSRGFEDREEYRAGSRSDQSRWPARSEQGRNDEPRSFQERNRDSEQEPYGREAWRPGEGLSQSGNYGNQTGQVGQYGQYGQSGPYGQYGQSGPYGYGNNDHGQRGQYGGGQYGRSQYGGGGQYGGGRGNYGGQPGAEAESYERYSPYNRGQPGPSQYGQPSEYERYQASQYNHYPEPHSSSRSEPDNWSRRAGQTGGDTPWDGRQRGMGEQIGEFGGAMAGRVRRMFRAPKGYTRSDERIREDVCDQLAHSQQVDPSDIEVSVKEGEVTLSGQVPERAMKWSVEQIVDAVSGVKDIHNQLRVRRDDNISTTSSTTQATASTPSTTRTTARS